MTFLETVMSVTIVETASYLERTGRPDSLERFSYLGYLAGAVRSTCHANSLREGKCVGNVPIGTLHMDAAKRDEGTQALRYQYLLRKLCGGGEDALMRTALNLALTVTYVPEFYAYLNYFTGGGATLALACGILGFSATEYGELEARWERLRLVLTAEDSSRRALSNLEANDGLLLFLSGEDGGDKALLEWAEISLCSEPLQPMYVNEELALKGERCFRRGDTLLQIAGSGGRRFLAKHIAKRLDLDLLLVEAGRLYDDGEPRRERLEQAVRDAFLYGEMVCIYGITRGGDDFFREVVEVFQGAGISVILCTDRQLSFSPREGGQIERLFLGELTREERERVWSGFSETYALPESPALCSVRYRLSASEISRVLKRWDKGKSLAACCEEVLPMGEKKLGQVVNPGAALSDLMVPEQTGRLLREIVKGSLEGYRLTEEWNLGGRYPYGLALSVLLTGAPGTGKTMTAHALAHELGMPLYQVDLSRILDKYIGETEKHLEQVFWFAEKTNTVLFFDEADALFGRRGEVTEGKDRYANMEVSYILQRIEQFSGVVVLATNFYHNIDKAFLRRMKYVIRYREPGQEQRRAIWESCLVPELAREELDLDYLASQFELTGGMIKNVLQIACISALTEERPLNMRHVLRAVRMEYEKLERSVAGDFFGKYRELMEGE